VLDTLIALKNYEAMLELWDYNEAKFKKLIKKMWILTIL
jgi:hypothetical protein